MAEVQEITMSQAEISDRLMKIKSEMLTIRDNVKKLNADIARKPALEEIYMPAVEAEQERLKQLEEEQKDLSYRQI